MSEGQPEILIPKHTEPGLLWGLASSALLHGLAIAFLLAFAHNSRDRPPMISYTVDLISAGELAGTNLVAGGRSKAPASAVARGAASQPSVVSEVPAPKPIAAEPQREEVLQVPPEPVEVEPPVNPQPQAPPPVPEPVSQAKAVVEAPVEQLPPKPAEPMEREVPPPAVVPARPNAHAEAAKKPVAETETKPAVRQRPAPTSVQAKVPTRAEVAQPKPTPVQRATSETTPAALEQQIAAAVQRRAQDQKIADAVRRRAHDAQIAAAVARRVNGTKRDGPSSGAAADDPGDGPISYGSGTGTSGAVVGVEMVLYLSQIERRLHENWVWSGTQSDLEATLYFDVADSGEVRNVRIESSSGNPSFDASVERAVRAASPLPPPPEKYRARFKQGFLFTFTPGDRES